LPPNKNPGIVPPWLQHPADDRLELLESARGGGGKQMIQVTRAGATMFLVEPVSDSEFDIVIEAIRKALNRPIELTLA